MSSEQLAAVILAAGSSSRMGGVKKEFIKIDNGLTVLGTSVNTFALIPSVKIIVIAVPENEEAAAREALPPELFRKNDPAIIFVNGGNTRSASVFNALSALARHNPCYVLIHDGARPRVSACLINNIIEAVKKYSAVIPLLPLTDTPKEIADKRENNEQSGFFVKRHLKRRNVGIAQTPQAFKFPEILYAYEKAAEDAASGGEEFTDDAEIWGRYGSCGGEVAVVPGEKENRKITFKEDLL